MSPFNILCIQSTLSVLVFAFIASVYVTPALNKLPFKKSLIPLLLVHSFRFAPLALLLPDINSDAVPSGVLETIAYGDFLAGVLAMLAVLFLHYNIKGAIAWVWGFNAIGILDVINALRLGVGSELYNYPLGFGWYILNFYVPLVIVTHVMMVSRLLRPAEAE